MAKKPMTKSQSVSHFAGKFELSKKTASAILEEVAALAVSETKKTGSFTLPGIGKLVLVKRKARMGRNPATGATIKIAAKTVLKFLVRRFDDEKKVIDVRPGIMPPFMPAGRALFEGFVISFLVFFDEPLNADVAADIISKVVALKQQQKTGNTAVSIAERVNTEEIQIE